MEEYLNEFLKKSPEKFITARVSKEIFVRIPEGVWRWFLNEILG